MLTVPRHCSAIRQFLMLELDFDRKLRAAPTPVSSGLRLSMPSLSIDTCTCVSVAVLRLAFGLMGQLAQEAWQLGSDILGSPPQFDELAEPVADHC